MTVLNEIIEQLKKNALHPDKAIAKSVLETGKEAVGCFPIYTPEEIIYAAGYLPVGMWGGKTDISRADKYLQSFCCSIMRSNIEYGMKGTYDKLKAVIIPTFCDTLKCICENWKVAVPHIPLMPIVYPQNRLLDVGFTYLVEEFDKIRKQMESLFDISISEEDLEEAFVVYEDYREAMRDFVETAKNHPNTIDMKTRHLIIKSGYFMDKKIYTDMIVKINKELKKNPCEEFNGPRVVGTGLLFEPVELLDTFVENNISLIADDFAQESRQFRVISRKEGTVLEKMAYRIVDQRGCTFLYEEKKTKGSMLINMVKENNAQAVVVCMMKFCDPEEFDYPIIKEELDNAGIPILYLETEMQLDSYEQVRTRVQSFAEMLI